MLKPFKIGDIGELDGGVVAAYINKALETVTKDCVNRPGVTKARAVDIRLSMIPVVNEHGITTEVHMEVLSAAKIPKSCSKTMELQVHPNGGLLFNAASPDDVRQHTMDELGDKPGDDESEG